MTKIVNDVSRRAIYIATPLLLTMFASSMSMALGTTAEERRQLGWCEGVYIYAAHYLQLSGNEPAARNSLSRAVATMVSNMFLNQTAEDKVPGEKLAESVSERRKVKPFLDANPDEILPATHDCDSQMQSLWARGRNTDDTLWGRSYPELHIEFMDKMKGIMGL